MLTEQRSTDVRAQEEMGGGENRWGLHEKECKKDEKAEEERRESKDTHGLPSTTHSVV